MNKLYAFALLVIIAISCTNFSSSKEQSDTLKTKAVTKMCPVKNQEIVLYSDNKKLNKLFEEFSKKQKLDFSEKFVFWNLLQLSARPDATSLNSKILTILKYQGKIHYISINPTSQKQNSFFSHLSDGLSLISKQRTSSLIKKFKKTFKAQIPISKRLQDFLERNKVAIYKDKILRKYIFKGNQIIKKGETIPLVKIEKLYKAARKWDTNYLRMNQLFDHPTGHVCSFDYRLYTSDSPMIERFSDTVNSNFFGLFQDSENYFMTLTSSSVEIKKVDKRSLSFISKPIKEWGAALCFNKSENKIIMAKNLIHSEQLMNNTLMHSQKLSIAQIINRKRYINLNYPVRSVVEIYGKKDQMNLKNTIYNIPTLGNIDIVSIDKRVSLYKDPRQRDLICK